MGKKYIIIECIWELRRYVEEEDRVWGPGGSGEKSHTERISMDIRDILTKEEYESLSQLKKEDIDWINERIRTRKDGTAGIECIVRGMNDDGDYFRLTPEEVVRQFYAYQLLTEYNYKRERLRFEEPVFFAGKARIDDKRIDISVYDKACKKIEMIIEVKRPRVSDYHSTGVGEASTPFQQMQSYCNQKHPQIGVLVNGSKLPEFYDMPDYESQLLLERFPQGDEDIRAWKEKRRYTMKQLMQADRLRTETLKDIVLEVEQRFGANDSSDKAFEEIFKLIFTKLYDEKCSADDEDAIFLGMNTYHMELKDIDDSEFRVLKFRAADDETSDEIYDKINKLFQSAQETWRGVFPADSVLNMQKATVKSCVKELQNVKLFHSNLEIVDDAFEHLVNQNQKEGMGQYFTPRYVIDMCVKMLNPRPTEYMIDTAAGSCGFPMHSIFHVWKQLNPKAFHLFSAKKRKPEEVEYVRNKVFGIDFSEKSVRVGRMLNIIAGDGHTNVLELNSLDFKKWESDYLKNTEWYAKYGEGFEKLVGLSADKTAADGADKYKRFQFDVLMANPPFAGDLDNREQIGQYDLGHKDGNTENKLQNKVGRDILFIERNLNFLKPGGRMAVILPQGRFNNSTDKYIRKYIMDRCRILAVVGLHGNVFKPHTGTKTSVLLVQKWTDENCGYPDICPRPKADEDGMIDYPIFFATMQEPGKDNSGNKIYVTEKYVRWCHYKYSTVKTIKRREDGDVISQEEFDLITDKEQYEKIYLNTAYIKKADGTAVEEAEYRGAKKKSDYKKVVNYEYRRKRDGKIFDESQFREITKKSNYVIKTETITKVEEHKTEDGSPRFIRDLFIREYGATESHIKWVRENAVFVIKDAMKNPGEKAEISIDKWLMLDASGKQLYKKKPVLGDNPNPEISNEEYCALTGEERKFYLIAEDIRESTERIKDTHGHIFVKHDLFNHDPMLSNVNPDNIYSQNGIAEAFAQFAYDNGLSFAPADEELEKIMHPANELPF